MSEEGNKNSYVSDACIQETQNMLYRIFGFPVTERVKPESGRNRQYAMSLGEIGKELGISAQGVRYIETRALEKVAKSLRKLGITE